MQGHKWRSTNGGNGTLSALNCQPYSCIDWRCTLAFQERVELRGSLLLERRQDVRISVQGQAHLRVPQGLHDRAGVDALSQQQGRARMSEVVNPHPWQLGLDEKGTKRLVNIVRIGGGPDRRRKDEPVVVPALPRR